MPDLEVQEICHVTETYISDKTNQVGYKVVTNDSDPSYQIFKATIEFEDTGDAESGPQLDSHLGPWNLIEAEGWSMMMTEPLELLQTFLKKHVRYKVTVWDEEGAEPHFFSEDGFDSPLQAFRYIAVDHETAANGTSPNDGFLFHRLECHRYEGNVRHEFHWAMTTA